MRDTYLKLSEAGVKRLLNILNEVSDKNKDIIWKQLHDDINRISNIWSNIDRRSEHLKLAGKTVVRKNKIVKNTVRK